MPRKKASKPQIQRLHMIVTDDVRMQIESLQERSGATNMTEVMRRALAVYDELVSVKEEGGKVLIEGADGKRSRLIVF